MTHNRILICGSRTWDDENVIWTLLEGLLRYWGDFTLIHGAAKGADSIAGEWVLAHNYGARVTRRYKELGLEEYPADWEKHGKAAGPIRNKQMLDEGKPDVVYAFTDNLEESRGTKNMVTQAKKAGLPVYVIGRA